MMAEELHPVCEYTWREKGKNYKGQATLFPSSEREAVLLVTEINGEYQHKPKERRVLIALLHPVSK